MPQREKGKGEEKGGMRFLCVYVFVCVWGGVGINISATWPLKPLPMTANIMKRYGSRERERNEKDKKRTVK